MNRGLRRRRLLAVGVSGVLLAAACGSDSESGDDDTAPPTSAAAEATNDEAGTDADTTVETTVVTTEPAGPTTTIATPEPVPVEPPEGMELVWSDEFDGDTIDLANWTYDIGGWGWGNGEQQYYTDRTENARTQNGLLVIELRRERFEDSYYTSARLKSQGLQEFQYGWMEARIKVPKGAGTWPAFWMLGAGFDAESDDPSEQWPNVGEIDIMEYVGREPDLVIGTIHGPGYSGSAGRSQWNRQEFDIADDFHTYAIDWDADGIRFHFDGEQYFDIGPDDLGEREWVFDQPFFFILNLALGGTLGGMIDLELEYPIQYYVDYVRVYQRVDEA